MHIRSLDVQRFLPDLTEVSRGSSAQQSALARQAFVSELTRQADELPPAATVERDDVVGSVEEREAGRRQPNQQSADDAQERQQPRPALSLEEMASLMRLPSKPGSAVDFSA